MRPQRPLLPRIAPYPAFHVLKPVREVASGMLTLNPDKKVWSDRAIKGVGPLFAGFPESELTTIPLYEVQRLETAQQTREQKPWKEGDARAVGHHRFRTFEFIRNNAGFMSRSEDRNPEDRDQVFRQEGRKVFKEVCPMAAEHISAQLETLGLMAETFVTVVVAFPLFLVVIMAIMAIVPGAGGNSDTTILLLYLVVGLMIPFSQFGFIFFIWNTTKESTM